MDNATLIARRENVRRALNNYRAALKSRLTDVPRGSGDADNEFDNIKASITQVDAAKRVLWMED